VLLTVLANYSAENIALHNTVGILQSQKEELLELYDKKAAEYDALLAQYEAIDKVSRGSATRKTIKITEVEFEKICRVVAAEAGNQSYLGQQLVAQCIYDRVASGLYGKNVDEVLDRPKQFAKPLQGNLNKFPSVYAAVWSVFYNNEMPVDDQVLIFYNPKIADPAAVRRLSTYPLIIEEGDHVFRGNKS